MAGSQREKGITRFACICLCQGIRVYGSLLKSPFIDWVVDIASLQMREGEERGRTVPQLQGVLQNETESFFHMRIFFLLSFLLLSFQLLLYIRETSIIFFVQVIRHAMNAALFLRYLISNFEVHLSATNE